MINRLLTTNRLTNTSSAVRSVFRYRCAANRIMPARPLCILCRDRANTTQRRKAILLLSPTQILVARICAKLIHETDFIQKQLSLPIPAVPYYSDVYYWTSSEPDSS
jgi:hypothetical protein